jgi:cation transport regulator ChaC
MDPKQLGERCPGAVLVGTALLPDHRVFVTRDGASLRAERGASVYGVVWEVTDQDLAALDAYEDTVQGVYRRETKHVKRLAQAASLDALVYVATEETSGAPARGYLETVIAAARHHGFPEAYLAELATWRGPRTGSAPVRETGGWLRS